MSDISYNRRVRYYIALYELFQEQECLHCVDIARKLSISLPAASRMLQKLISEGLIEKKKLSEHLSYRGWKGTAADNLSHISRADFLFFPHTQFHRGGSSGKLPSLPGILSAIPYRKAGKERRLHINRKKVSNTY
ncbi:winged helix-turn-helix transcriptional regulator [[Clostridium] innocuum]|nr:winged helix-turn-helix transcriptional regulator [[Clostridium] innocuum]